MMQTIPRSTISASILSVAILISGAHYNVARAQDNSKQHRMAEFCGKELKKQCSGGAVAGAQRGTGVASVLDCFQKAQTKLPANCVPLADNVVRMCDADSGRLCQGVVASPDGNIVGCLTMARHVVSSQCNAALDAAGLR